MTTPDSSNAGLVAFCGLYCGNCGKYKAGRCGGCRENQKASWCKVRACGLERGYRSCADCKDFDDVTRCRKFQNPIRRIVSWFFNSDLPATIRHIRAVGPETYAREMAANGGHALKRR